MTSNVIFQHRQRFQRVFVRSFFGLFTEYETPKLVVIHSLSLTILLRLMQAILLIYSILYLLLYEKGYQKQDTSIVSSVTLKVKGIGYIHTAQNGTLIIDVADYIIPPSENNAIFIMSSYGQTDQTRSKCPESLLLKEAECDNDDECQNKPFSPRANGRWTGRCILPSEGQISNDTFSKTKPSKGLCEYAGWCPPENDEASPALINEVLNFTIFIKNFIEFPVFAVKHKNMVDDLKPCVFHANLSKDCPIFTLDYIVNQAEKDAEERDLMLRLGGVISVKLDWDCDLDRGIKLCKPEYTFARLDVPFREKPFSRGFNFRYAFHWKSTYENHRTLTKAYGLRLIIAVSGKAGKFDSITLSLNTGSLVGIFGLATFFCDIILLHLSKKARTYRKHVFEAVHLRTRFSSVLERPPDLTSTDVKEKSTVLETTTSRTDLVNAMYEVNTKSLRKTSSTRPLTLTNSEKMKVHPEE
ncbi:unnamed protein product [Adineta steineri]|uniref:P2X purinoceptor n=1 Tax=Adineta steineri TaxID=433720 RepID=A0A814ZVR6_9BILA|nr:unnamed protein product [Adineta steineri]CAF1532743.1 unnamed protein product [Adineta steineri]